MKLHRITMTNFRSFTYKQTFRFPDQPGLYFMQGVNEVEPRLEGNAAGKSTIWDALLWVAFNKTSWGLKAGDVCSWDVSKGVVVELAYQTEGNVSMQVMRRTWGPNSWTLTDLFGNVVDLTKDQSNKALEAFKLEFTPFLHSILMAQSQPMFLDLKHDKQAELFSEVLGLDHWLDFSKKASVKASSQDQVSRGLERQLSEIVGRINAQQDFKGSVEQFEADREVRIKAFEEPYEQGKNKVARLKKGLDHVDKQVVQFRAIFRECDDRLLRFIDAEIAPYNKELALIERDLDRAEVKYLDLQDQLDDLRKSEFCKTCGQAIAAGDHRKHLKKAEEEVSEQHHVVLKLLESKRLLKVKGQKILAKQDQLSKETNESYADLEAFELEARQIRQTILTIDKELDDIEDRVEALETEVNPFLEVQTKAKEEGKRLREAQAETQHKLDRSSELYQLYSYWVRGFKELRLQLIAEALVELEIEVNSCVTALGLVNWELRFQVDRETKGGSIQRGFSVEVISPIHKRPTPWEAWSGGEKQRLRVAATMGLANLIRSRMGVGLDLEVWDEPSMALSPRGVQDLLEALEHRAIQESRQIFIVDHTSYSFGGFTGVCTIRKTAKGSVVEASW